jgi:hypothetical protein
MDQPLISTTATFILGIAVVHTFLCGSIRRLGSKFPEGSIQENLFHWLGEVEVVFGLWAAVFFAASVALVGSVEAIHYLESRNFAEPIFVLVIMATASTRPVISTAEMLIDGAARFLPVSRDLRGYVACLIFGPLLGSFITEPAAMTLIALILRDRYFSSASDRFKYLTLAVLFVNVSIGGALTSYAAPPVLMVAAKWNWDTAFMLSNFGWKVVIAVVVNAIGASLVLRSELRIKEDKVGAVVRRSPLWLTALHLGFLGFMVIMAHHPAVFVGAFLFFLGVFEVTKEHQDDLQLKPALMVAFFLSGIVVLGGAQGWWLQPLLSGMDNAVLFLGATGLTAITDNAALTYLGSQVEGISSSFQYALVAGAIAGGGLTVIANAPNPAGFSILQPSFGGQGVRPFRLLSVALVPTLVAMACLWFL